MKILYFDCPSGISGDMCLGSLVDLGVDIKKIKRELKKLPVEKVAISTSREKRRGITGTRFSVKTKESALHRSFSDIKRLIEKSRLSKGVKSLSISIFNEIAVAEGKVHGVSPQKVHFHEVGAMDSIVDIVGTAVAVESLDVKQIYSSPLPLGSGFVDTAHGRLPVPAPATLEILKGVPVLPSSVTAELTTPTGAAIIKTLAKKFGAIPPMKIESTGCGIGTKDFQEAPNLLRVIMGSTEGSAEELVMMETNIDDMSPQIIGFLMERLFRAGALDVFCTPVQMKKNRPGTLLTVLSDRETKERLLDIIFKESTSIGVRCYPVERFCLERKSLRVRTRYGTVRVKVSFKDKTVVNAQPEYEDCRRIAEKKKLALKEVMNEALAALKGPVLKNPGRCSKK